MDAPSDPAEARACPACAHPLQGGERFCPDCGQALGAPPKCPHCDAALKPEDRFCHRCGASLLSPARCPSCEAEVPAGATRCPSCEILLVGPRPAPDAQPAPLAPLPEEAPAEETASEEAPRDAPQSSSIGANVLVFVAVTMLVVVGVYELSKVQHAPPPAARPPMPSARPSAPPAQTAEPLVGGSVALPPGAKPPPGATLFISLRTPAGGPPVAAIRVDRPQFPVAFTITSADMMMPGAPPSGPFLIQARLDQDGDAQTRAEGELSARGLEPVPKGSMKQSLTLGESH